VDLANFPWLTMLSVIAQIFAGAMLNNLDAELRDFFSKREPLIVPLMAFMLGLGLTSNRSSRPTCEASSSAPSTLREIVLSDYSYAAIGR
jgi:hypothetical protein